MAGPIPAGTAWLPGIKNRKGREMKLISYINFAILIVFIITGCQKQKASLTQEQKLAEFFKKKEVTVLVTDSGLGGLSVAADVAERMKKNHVFQKVNVIFFNAQPHLHSGYNSMKTTEQKVKVFNNALISMNREFKPDVLLIACNTLSVLYDYTDFSKTAPFPVIGIVKTGADLIEREIQKDSASKVIIFATKTTVKQDKHRKQLVADGIAPERIVTQACPHLAGRIERGPQSDTTRALVRKYVDNALSKLDDDKAPLYVSYNCTHYGYVNDVFQKTFKEKGREVRGFLDPNPLLADFMFTRPHINRYPQSTVNVKVVSQPELTPGKIAAIYGLIEPVSAQTAEALMDYEFRPDFFEWESIAKGK